MLLIVLLGVWVILSSFLLCFVGSRIKKGEITRRITTDPFGYFLYSILEVLRFLWGIFLFIVKIVSIALYPVVILLAVAGFIICFLFRLLRDVTIWFLTLFERIPGHVYVKIVAFAIITFFNYYTTSIGFFYFFSQKVPNNAFTYTNIFSILIALFESIIGAWIGFFEQRIRHPESTSDKIMGIVGIGMGLGALATDYIINYLYYRNSPLPIIAFLLPLLLSAGWSVVSYSIFHFIDRFFYQPSETFINSIRIFTVVRNAIDNGIQCARTVINNAIFYWSAIRPFRGNIVDSLLDFFYFPAGIVCIIIYLIVDIFRGIISKLSGRRKNPPI